MSDGALSFAGFFFTFLIHTAFSIWSAVGPGFVGDGQDFSHTGWLPTLQLFKGDGGGAKFVAICYAVGTTLHLLCDVHSRASIARSMITRFRANPHVVHLQRP